MCPSEGRAAALRESAFISSLCGGSFIYFHPTSLPPSLGVYSLGRRAGTPDRAERDRPVTVVVH